MARPKPLADLIAPTLGPVLAGRGFASHDLVASWPEIVGERLATHSAPARVDWPRRDRGSEWDRRPEPATLVVRVESAFAVDLQHLAPVVLERVNAHYGWRCIGRLVLKQGPVARKPRRAPAPPPASAEAERRVACALAGLGAPDLAAALAALGRGVLGQDETRGRAPEPTSSP